MSSMQKCLSKSFDAEALLLCCFVFIFGGTALFWREVLQEVVTHWCVTYIEGSKWGLANGCPRREGSGDLADAPNSVLMSKLSAV